MFNFFSCLGNNPSLGSYAYLFFNKVPKVQLAGITSFLQAGNLDPFLSMINDTSNFTKHNWF